jgi:hypothetical protein
VARRTRPANGVPAPLQVLQVPSVPHPPTRATRPTHCGRSPSAELHRGGHGRGGGRSRGPAEDDARSRRGDSGRALGTSSRHRGACMSHEGTSVSVQP